MGSHIPGYSYDVFISYRQNDNKYDGWVTEFVANLNKELEATIKEKVTVYFDANPQDGLLETHSVDGSLEEKLRCLIFIPILSRTYCDPKSYAWNNEFLTFLNKARKDNIGLNVKLSSGNVASRVLPIRIHDLNPEDISLVESQIGVIRAIDFIYKEPGVNRSLTPKDSDDKNANKTSYRNQINKVANAIDGIIRGLKIVQTIGEGGNSKHDQTTVQERKEDGKREAGEYIRGKSKRRQIIALFLLLSIVGVFAFYKVVLSGKQALNEVKLDKSIAVLPFVNDSPDKDNEYFCNGMMEEILTQLQNIHDLKVKSRTSVEKYRDTEKDIIDIGNELGVYMIMEGSVRKIDDNLRISVQLINAKTGDHLWAETYDGKYTSEIFDFQGSVAKKVAVYMNGIVTPLEAKKIGTKPTTQIVAHDLALKSEQILRKWRYTRDSLDYKISLNLVNQALKVDPEYIDALRIKGDIFASSTNYDSAWYYFDRIQKLDPENALGYRGKAVVFYYYRNMPDSALLYCFKADKLVPDDPWNYLLIGQIYCMQKNDLINGLIYYNKAIVSGGGSEGEINENIADAYFSIDYYEKAEKYMKNAIYNNPEFPYIKNYGSILLIQGKYDECLHFLDSISSISRCEAVCDMVRFRIYVTQKDFEKAEKYYNLSVANGHKPNQPDRLYLAYLYNETGRKKEAVTISKSVIEFYDKLLSSIRETWEISTFNLRLAAAYAMLNENTKALKCLSEVESKGPDEKFISIKSFPGFDNLRNDPDYKAVVKRLEDKKASLRAQVKDMELRGELNL